MGRSPSNASLASEASKKVAVGKRGSAVSDAKGPATYQDSKQIKALHALSVATDVLIFVILVSLVVTGSLPLQIQVDGYFIDALIALFHVLLNIPLLLAVYRKWNAGFTIFISTGIPWIIASVAVFIYMLIDEWKNCKKDTKLDHMQTRCFGPPILLFSLILVQGLLHHRFNARWQLVNSKHIPKVHHHASSHIETGTGTGGNMTLLQQGTLTPGIFVGESQRTVQTKEGSAIVASPKPPPSPPAAPARAATVPASKLSALSSSTLGSRRASPSPNKVKAAAPSSVRSQKQSKKG